MSISDLGSLGELIAAVATVATLLYLATQIRENTKIARSESQRGVASLRMQSLTAVTGSTEGPLIFSRGLLDPRSLDMGERTQFNFQFSTLLCIYECTFFDYELGLIDSESLDAYGDLALQLLPTPGGMDYWSNFQNNHNPVFRRYIQAKMDSRS